MKCLPLIIGLGLGSCGPGSGASQVANEDRSNLGQVSLTSEFGQRVDRLNLISEEQDAQEMRGIYRDRYEFTVKVRASIATLIWDDGYPGFDATLNSNPSPRPRCPCDVFESANGQRRITLLKDIVTGRYQSVTFQRMW